MSTRVRQATCTVKTTVWPFSHDEHLLLDAELGVEQARVDLLDAHRRFVTICRHRRMLLERLAHATDGACEHG